MPIDPSIISNAFANASNNMPDVNALMQQRIQGAENIYQIEAGRQEQAAQAEKEAAQQAAEAMLPAVASAFSDPSDDGLDAAASMLPPEVSQAFTPFLQRLKGIGDTKQRMAILRAELAKDDEGRYILGQLEPTANMALQAKTAAGAQSLAEQRLKLDILKQEAEAAGGGVSPDVAANLAFQREKLAAEAKKGTAEEVKKRISEDKRTKDIAFAVKEVETAAAENGLLDQATGSLFGNLIRDTTAQLFGYGTEGAIANAKMKPIADLVLKLVPRFEGPQSDKDTQSYRDAAGDLANPNLPASVKKAAAAQIVDLLKKYSGQFEYPGGEDTGGGEDVDVDNPLLSDGVQ
tara:strand:- start:2473 stop:3516 length:1044 start_codon:yes stop_codon:yes gene_type:complete